MFGFWVDGLLLVIQKKISNKEILWTCSTILFNSIITLIGYELFVYKIVVFDFEFSILKILVDFVILVLAMDFLMYLFHWAIHKLSFIYRYHDLHHVYNEPTAISLFVLHPLEVFGFGSLWLIVISCMNFSIYATIIYLIFNVVMGIIGHLTHEAVPGFIANNKYFQWFANTSFHVDHHQDESYNFGFYTKLWDRIFGTLK